PNFVTIPSMECFPKQYLDSLAAPSNFPPYLRGLTPVARQSLLAAFEETRRLRHSFLGTDHLLLGLIKVNQGSAVNALNGLGLNLPSVVLSIDVGVGTGPESGKQEFISLTPR